MPAKKPTGNRGTAHVAPATWAAFVVVLCLGTIADHAPQPRNQFDVLVGGSDRALTLETWTRSAWVLAAAWALVTVASATLWITQQLDLWAIAVQVIAILVSLTTAPARQLHHRKSRSNPLGSTFPAASRLTRSRSIPS